jgi:hypothetical protein
MTQQPFNNPASYDCETLRQNRLAAVAKPTSGDPSRAWPRLPAESPWSHGPGPVEAPLGRDVNALEETKS